MNQPAVNDEASQARVAAYHEADARGRSIHGHRGEGFTHTFTSSAKEMVSKMVIVANSDKPEHKKIVNDAFGPNANREKIKATIHKLNTQQVKIGTTDVAAIKNAKLIATTPVERPNGPAGPIKLGPSFFGKFSAIFTISSVLKVLNISVAADSSKDFRAGTLIHEATHQQSHTGDFINKDDRIIGALEEQQANPNLKMQENNRPHVACTFAPFLLQVRVHGFS